MQDVFWVYEMAYKDGYAWLFLLSIRLAIACFRLVHNCCKKRIVLNRCSLSSIYIVYRVVAENNQFVKVLFLLPLECFRWSLIRYKWWKVSLFPDLFVQIVGVWWFIRWLRNRLWMFLNYLLQNQSLILHSFSWKRFASVSQLAWKCTVLRRFYFSRRASSRCSTGIGPILVEQPYLS